MKLAELDKTAVPGESPLRSALRWLENLVQAKVVNWDTAQRAAAREALDAANKMMDSELVPFQNFEMHPVGTADKLRRMDAALKEVNVRIAFVNWPAEGHWNAGTKDVPIWMQDWRKTIAYVDHARHGGPAPTEEQLQHWKETSVPWNMIPKDQLDTHRDGALSQALSGLMKACREEKHQVTYADLVKVHESLRVPKDWRWLPEDLWTHLSDWEAAVEQMVANNPAPAKSEGHETEVTGGPTYWEHQRDTLKKIREQMKG